MDFLTCWPPFIFELLLCVPRKYWINILWLYVASCEDGKFAMFDAVLLSGMVKLIGETQEVRNSSVVNHCRPFLWREKKINGHEIFYHSLSLTYVKAQWFVSAHFALLFNTFTTHTHTHSQKFNNMLTCHIIAHFMSNRVAAHASSVPVVVVLRDES